MRRAGVLTKNDLVLMMMFIKKISIAFCLLFIASSSYAQQTEKVYLSGTGSDDMVQWDFYCTAGMNSGKWTKIGVPSCWELQGFGKYDYGFAKDSVRGKESGLYKYQFHAPASWKSKVINIVFEGVMTDATVTINGKKAGPVHQGAFYAFKYDISKLLKYGQQNLLEVKVDKHSANKSVNAAEREADFWIFGGIFRPVWLEALPAAHISQVAIDAKADGLFTSNVNAKGAADKIVVRVLDKDNKEIANTSANITKENQGILATPVKAPALWSSEYPDLYKAVFSLYKNEKLVHQVEKKFGFRTVEVKQRDGIYINGVKIKFKGVNRHSFRPETGRTTSKLISIEDVQLMKDMNMNAVRMSHYPPDDHFLDVCDSLGLYVMDELAGWHGHYNTETGTKLLKEMVAHDVNHPSIFIWANGNEGGHNTDLDKLFTEYDIQKRSVVQPWKLFNGINTQHYREYNYGIGDFENGRDIYLPTEFLHGWFDGGHGAGLEDYWEKMWHTPLSAGGFLWDFADQGVMRKDLNDSLDTDKNRGADGIIGPHLEKEGSYYAIKEIWSPVYFEKREMADDFDGRLYIENRYHFTNINECNFTWKLKKFGLHTSEEETGSITAPDIKPAAKGSLKLQLPDDWRNYSVLYVTAKNKADQEIFTWSFPILRTVESVKEIIGSLSGEKPVVLQKDSLLTVTTSGTTITFNTNNGSIEKIVNAKGELPFNNGPVVQQAINNLKNFKHKFDNDTLVLASTFDRKNAYNTLQWKAYPNGWIKMEANYFPQNYFTDFVGVNFSFPESRIKSVTYMGDGPYRVWKNRLKGTKFGVWTKEYNNTETGEYPWKYPEFKGYHADFYGGYFFTKDGNRFTVATETEGIFLRLFTPAWKTDQWHNYEPYFPSGDISFMNGIPSIGAKNQRNVTTGPMGFQNIYYDYEKEPSRALNLVLWFNFSGQ